MLSKYFGKALSTIRQQKGLTQDQLADICNFGNRTTVSKLETGDRRPLLDTFIVIANALEIEPEDLIKKMKEIEKNDS